MKRPYTFPHRSRKAMIAYLLDRRTYVDHYRHFVFNWNVKAHSVDYDRPAGEYDLNPEFDAAWIAQCADEHGPVYWAFQDAGRYLLEGEWTSYPGDDQGAWQFSFAGRQGGHLVLEKWGGHHIAGESACDIENWLKGLDTDTLRSFYRGIRTADSDFTPVKASQEVEHHLNFHRHEWESEMLAERDKRATAFAEQAMAERPDMYCRAT